MRWNRAFTENKATKYYFKMMSYDETKFEVSVSNCVRILFTYFSFKTKSTDALIIFFIDQNRKHDI